MEINRRFLTVLTPGGEFLHVRRQDQLYQVGQEINFSSKELEKKRVPFSMPVKVALTACAFVLVFISIIPVYQNNQVYAYMSIDINPSIELGVNKNYEVVEIIPYNEDGKKIVNQLGVWNKKDVHNVAREIIHEIKTQGYVKNNHEVVIATVYAQETMDDNDTRWDEEMDEIQAVIQSENLDL